MTADLGAGLGLKPRHYDAAVACTDGGLWFEVHPENYLVAGGPRLAWLETVRNHRPLSLHGVSLSLAAPAPPCTQHLARLRELVQRFQPALVSEHLAWSSWRGHYYPDLLPIVRTSATLAHIADNVARTQDALGRQIAIENPSHYLDLPNHELCETDFLAELARRSGCLLLVDVNNVHVGAHNLGYDARCWLDALPAHAVAEIHLAGHTADAACDLLIDTHDAAIAAPVWDLYQHLLDRIGARPTLIERDGNIPEFAVLLDERRQAQRMLDGTIA
jgi:uncharacterized protein (UPF0276 family)